MFYARLCRYIKMFLHWYLTVLHKVYGLWTFNYLQLALDSCRFRWSQLVEVGNPSMLGLTMLVEDHVKFAHEIGYEVSF